MEYLPKTMETSAPNVAQRAKLADRKSGPSYMKYTMMGALLGAFCYCAFLIFGYLTDDTIHTPEDMEKYFGIIPLTSIPDSELYYKETSDTEKKQLFRKG